jgi:hypothetical protein
MSSPAFALREWPNPLPSVSCGRVSPAYVAGVLCLAVMFLSPRNITRVSMLDVDRLCRFQRRANFFKGRWRTGPATAADASALGAVGASDLSKGGRYEFHSSRPQPRTDADSHHGNPRRHRPRTSTSRVRNVSLQGNGLEEFLLAVRGSPDPMGMDGLGGNTILQSKVAIVSPSSRCRGRRKSHRPPQTRGKSLERLAARGRPAGEATPGPDPTGGWRPAIQRVGHRVQA